MKPIVTLSLNPCIDASSQTDDVRPMRKNRISNERFDPGGGDINVARVVKKLGGDAHAVYLAGGLTGQTLDKMIDGIGLVSGRSIEGALRLAVAAGTAAVFTMGTELCRRADVDRLDDYLAREAARGLQRAS